MRVSKVLVLLAFVVSVAACNSNKRENIQPPKELQDIVPRLQVAEIWQRKIGDVGGTQGLSIAPTYADGRLYLANLDGDIFVLDAANGREAARFEVDHRLATSVAVGEGVLAIGTLDGKLLVLDASTASERFAKQLSSEVIAAPVIADGKVFARSHDGRIQAFQLSDGRQIWSQDFEIPVLSLRGNGRMVHYNGVLLAGLDDGRLVALRAEDGGEVWQHQVGVSEGRTDLERLSDLDGDLSVLDGVVYAVGLNGQSVAVDASSGNPLWSHDISAASGTAAGDQVLVSAINGTVTSLERYGGSVTWTQEGLENRWLSTPALVNGYPVVGDFEGYVHWLDPADGAFVARERAGRDPIRSTPLVVDGITYVMTVEGALTAYRVGS